MTFKTKKGPKLLLKGTGDLKRSSIGHMTLSLPSLRIKKRMYFLLIV